jgi:hypothetical protein
MTARKTPTAIAATDGRRRFFKDWLIAVLLICLVAFALAAVVLAYDTQQRMDVMQKRGEIDRYVNCRQTQIMLELLRRTGGPALSLPSMCRDYDLPAFMLQK